MVNGSTAHDFVDCRFIHFVESFSVLRNQSRSAFSRKLATAAVSITSLSGGSAGAVGLVSKIGSAVVGLLDAFFPSCAGTVVSQSIYLRANMKAGLPLMKQVTHIRGPSGWLCDTSKYVITWTIEKADAAARAVDAQVGKPVWRQVSGQAEEAWPNGNGSAWNFAMLKGGVLWVRTIF